MGNVTSNDLRNSSTSGGSSKVIFWNGTVAEFTEPLTVAELMMEHPKQVVVELRPDYIAGKTKPTPLPADQNLDPNKLYLMVPLNKRGKPSAFSGEEAQRLLVAANAALRRRTGPGLVAGSRFLPLLVRVCAGRPETAAAAVCDKFTVRMKMKNDDCGKNDDDDVAVEGKKWGPEADVSNELYNSSEFLMSGRRWKPSLDTIVEKEMVENYKVNHWLF